MPKLIYRRGNVFNRRGVNIEAGASYSVNVYRAGAQLKHVDNLVGELLAAIPANSHIVIQADHGGHERTHGTDMPEDMTIPWMATGPDIKAGYRITQTVSLIDTAPTLARMLGIGTHEDWNGNAVNEMFID